MLEAREKSSTLEVWYFHVRGRWNAILIVCNLWLRLLRQSMCFRSLAVTAETNHYVRPVFNDEHRIVIDQGRHAVVEKVMGVQEYIPNTITFDSQTNVQPITGPKHDGKSTCGASVGLVSRYETRWLRWALTYQQIVAWFASFDAIVIHVLVLQMTWFQVSRPSWLRWWEANQAISARHLQFLIILMSWDVDSHLWWYGCNGSIIEFYSMTRWG